MDLNTIDTVVRPRARNELGTWRAGDGWLAGGTWLFSEPQPHLRRLIDLQGLGWAPHAVSEAGLHLGATCTLAELAALELQRDWIAAPLLRQGCEALLGSFKIQVVATVGGNLCLGLPAGPIAALATALEATCRIWEPDGGARALPASDFVTGPQCNALQPGEMLRSIDIPAAAMQRRFALRRASLTPLGRSAALLIGTSAQDGTFALTITASTPRPVRLVWPAPPGPKALLARIEAQVPVWLNDVHGRSDWRRHRTLALAGEILAELAAPAGGLAS